jgi:hypothetical protein
MHIPGMKIYVFEAAKDRTVYGFTKNPQGSNLPPDNRPWKPFKSVDMNSGEPSRGGVNTDAVLMGIADIGFYVTAAQINWTEIV